MANSEYEYVKREFEFDRHLPPSNWIVVRIDGCHFHRYMTWLKEEVDSPQIVVSTSD